MCLRIESPRPPCKTRANLPKRTREGNEAGPRTQARLRVASRAFRRRRNYATVSVQPFHRIGGRRCRTDASSW